MTQEENERIIPDNSYCKNIADRLPAACMILRRNRSGRILYINRRGLDLFECENRSEFDELTGGSFFGIIYDPDVEPVRWLIRQKPNNGIDSDEEIPEEGAPIILPRDDFNIRYRIVTASKRTISVYHNTQYIDDPELGRLAYLLMYPQTKTKFIETDSLTGLFDMRTMFDFETSAIRSGRKKPGYKAYCIFINLIGFKYYNMKHGFEKGDRFLIKTAEILKECFPGDHISRLSADHFSIFTTQSNIVERLTRVRERVMVIRGESSVTIKAGVYAVDGSQPFDPGMASDLSITACDIIHDDDSRFIQFYNEDVAQAERLHHYIEDNIDNAISRGHIQVYFQPIVRSISRRLCGFEALARWISPKFGFLNPGDFIPILEESRQIHKLDTFMIEAICRRLRMEMDYYHPVVPVSFNLSRIDFFMSDPFTVIEKTLNKYDIPQNMIRIEITESSVIDDREKMAEEIDRFENAGYQVWMDDFGSGYSSLNVLKDYHFNNLKIDMEFMRNYSETSREIVASTVKMAKSIHSHSLAEGVETEEQVEFLRHIGCEKLQGYYFGRPLPYEESVDHCLKEGLTFEETAFGIYYRKIGSLNFQTDKPMSVIEYDGSHLKVIYSNKQAMDLMSRLTGRNISNEKDMLSQSDPAVTAHQEEFLKSYSWKDEIGVTRELVLSEHGSFIEYSITCIAAVKNYTAFTFYYSDLINVSGKEDNIDFIYNSVGSFNQFYDNVILCFIDPDKDYVETRLTDAFFTDNGQTHYQGVEKYLADFGKRLIHPDDQGRYFRDTCISTAPERIHARKNHCLVGQYRMLQSDGTYHWKVFVSFMLKNQSENILMITIMDAVVESDPNLAAFYNDYYSKNKLDMPK